MERQYHTRHIGAITREYMPAKAFDLGDVNDFLRDITNILQNIVGISTSLITISQAKQAKEGTST